MECDSVYSDGQPFILFYYYYYFIFIIIVIAISIIIIFIIIIIIMIFFIWNHSSTLSHLYLCAPFLSEASCQQKEFASIKQMFSPRAGPSGESLLGKSNRTSEQSSVLAKVAETYCGAPTHQNGYYANCHA